MSLLDAARREGAFVFGAGGFARDVARALGAAGVPVHGFVTSAEPAAPQVDGRPVQKLDPAALHAPLWVGAFNREPHSDYAALARLFGAARVVWPQAFYATLREALGFRFWLQPPADYAAHADDIAAARALLDDDASRDAFDRMLAFRREAFAQPPAPHGGIQYLPAWLREHVAARGPLCIVDGGAYRGETLAELAAATPIAQAWSFEPDAANHAALVQALAGVPWQATHVPAGLSDRCGSVGFTQGQGEANHVSRDPGAPQVPVVALDDCLHRAPVNFLKLDVEGHELAALAGARRTIARERPVLAVAAYHRWDDLWRIPAFVRETGLNYRLRLGLHGHNSFDSVYYAF